MMSRRFFWGESAVDSILKVAANVNQQFLESANSKGPNFKRYQPWMAIPFELLKINTPPNWLNGSLFFSEEELKEFADFIALLNPGQAHIFSLENYPLKVSCLSANEAERFRNKILESKIELEARLRWIKPIYDFLIQKIVPIKSLLESDDSDYGMSTIWLKGIIFYDWRQHRPFEFRIENIAHELAHQIIINYQLSDRIIEDDFNRPVYSGIRKVERPAIMAFHGAAALSYMLLAAKALAQENRVQEIRSNLLETLKSLEDIQMTSLGKILLREMYESAA